MPNHSLQSCKSVDIYLPNLTPWLPICITFFKNWAIPARSFHAALSLNFFLHHKIVSSYRLPLPLSLSLHASFSPDRQFKPFSIFTISMLHTSISYLRFQAHALKLHVFILEASTSELWFILKKTWYPFRNFHISIPPSCFYFLAPFRNFIFSFLKLLHFLASS